MLKPETITFLTQLSQNNNKPWFDEHREDYAAAKENFEAIVGDILDGLAATEQAFKEQKAKDCIFRIFRDVRFSKDKTPYKPNFGAFFSKGGRKFPGAGYYIHIEPGNRSFAGGGIWQPEAPLLKLIRQEIDYNFDEFKEIIGNKKFKSAFSKIEGEQLKTLPQGYTEDNPAIGYLKLKSFTVMHHLPDDEIAGNGLVKKTTELFTLMKPYIDFLNRAALH